ncbi:MAG TPA: class A beta-lactamase [Rhizomicrobium sp.]
MIDRRSMVIASAALAFAAPARAHILDAFIDLEKKHDGRLGVSALDTQSGGRMEHRGDERFAMCSTFKLLATAVLLHRVDKGSETLSRRLTYGKTDLLSYAPVAKQHIREGQMSLATICEAAIEWSDNSAANLLLAAVGGPGQVTAYARELGDDVTRLDRNEPALNDVVPGDIRDTTSPNAMLRDMQKILLGDALSNASRDRLTRWLRNSQTGKERLRAGLPRSWAFGDKTGTGFRGETNDIGIAWPKGRAPILIAAYYAGSKAPQAAGEAVLAEVGRVVAQEFAS